MLTLVLGGARSGKSRYARELCGDGAVCYIATAQSRGDPEMSRRIERHRAERPAGWTTVEAPIALVDAVRASDADVVLVDCVTVWLSNLAYRHRSLRAEARERRVLGEVGALVDATKGRKTIAVSNEVGGGIVPDSVVGREFRDLQGLANQMLASAASRVYLMVAGIPLTLKDSG